jgi:hypothetical protein
VDGRGSDWAVCCSGAEVRVLGDVIGGGVRFRISFDCEFVHRQARRHKAGEAGSKVVLADAQTFAYSMFRKGHETRSMETTGSENKIVRVQIRENTENTNQRSLIIPTAIRRCTDSCPALQVQPKNPRHSEQMLNFH